ncbi:MAG: H-NS histone family protein [Candidimonas sp.]|nr:MAG: H-NS histone family protein [Candidimonas sp.]TAM19640.1 MAG: H-NS histone family protein [Candidimonas sp.]
MTRDTYFALKLKIEKEIVKLQKKAHDLQAKRRNPIIASIIRSMAEYDITPEEIMAAYRKHKRGSKASAPKPTAATTPESASKRTVPVKYRHPQTGECWTGRGKAPRWITTAEAAGENRESFRLA